MNQLSNVEFLLLLLLMEFGHASGYEVNKTIEERGYREWAHIGTTSIYTGLQKLRDKGLVQAEAVDKTAGKGPAPTRFAPTAAGRELLLRDTRHSLSTARERDARFTLGLAALPYISREDAIEALQARQRLLEDAQLRLRTAYEAQGGADLPLHVRALFIQPMHLMESEQQFMIHLLHELKETKP